MNDELKIIQLESACQRLSMEGKLKQGEINALTAQVKEITTPVAGALLNLDQLVDGAKVQFSTAPDGFVFSVHDQVTGMDDRIVEARLFIRHDDNSESYHTYRYDGRSHHCPSHDIVRVTEGESK